MTTQQSSTLLWRLTSAIDTTRGGGGGGEEDIRWRRTGEQGQREGMKVGREQLMEGTEGE